MNPIPARSTILFFALSSLAQADTTADNVVDSGKLVAERLRCEYRNCPLGVDKVQPELSWIVTSEARAQVQSAYRILVASSPELLSKNRGDLWDSGKVESDATFGVLYAGTDLRSHQQCFWKVMVWDGGSLAGAWSKPAYWSMGILNPGEWRGDWIGYDGLRHLNSNPPAAPIHGARWIAPAKYGGGDAPRETNVYVGLLHLPEDIEIVDATVAFCSDDASLLVVNGHTIAQTQNQFEPTTEHVAAYVHGGRNEVRVRCRNDAKGPTGICLKLVVEDSEGAEYILTTDDRWLVMSSSRSWRTQSIDNASEPRVLGPFGIEPWGQPVVKRDVSAPPSYLRSGFSVKKPVRRATVYLASLGLADLSLNGALVNRDYFSSGWTNYRRRVYYRAYDVTDMMRQGENVWGAVLADGWYAGHIGWGARRDFYGTKPRFRAMLRVSYDDDTSETFTTGRHWEVTRGPTQLADFLVGEEYDATLEVRGWDQPGGTPPRLASVDVGAEVAPIIQWHPGPAVVEIGEFPAKSFDEPVPGVYVYDIGQNIAGVARVAVNGRKGQRVKIRYAERLNPDGTLYTTNLRLARATDYYTCKGVGEEVWQPRQTFHGFQYIELSGLDEPPPIDAVTGVALSSDTALASEFDCSDPDINRLYQNVLWTQRSNFIDVPTDCPQRDERLGWTGDAQVYVYTACRVSDVQAFFRKWLVDLSDAQRADGQMPRVAPVIPGEEDGGPAWADAGVICPWEIYQAYGDRRVLERQYPSMVRFVEFCRARSRDEVLPPEKYHTFGDWLSVRADTPHDIIYMAYYARSVDLLQRSAEALGKLHDAEKYADLLERIKEAFVKNYVATDGSVEGNTQTAYVLAIGYGLVDGELRDKAAKNLIDNIESRGWKLSTGFVGTKDLMLVLSDIGRTDVAIKLLHQPEYPGWLFSIGHGATSIWERWDGWTPDRGFQDPGMNSFAHYSFGAVYGWMVRDLGGIRNAAPGFRELVIQPTFDPNLKRCRVVYDSIRGPIMTDWKLVGGTRELTVDVPANTNAVLKLMGQRTNELIVDGQSIASGELTAEDQTTPAGHAVARVELPSGRYQFIIPR